MSNEVRANFEQFPQVKAVRALLHNTDGQFLDGILQQFGADGNSGDVDLDLVIENQRGMKFFGIPMFSNGALIPWFDPPSFQLMNGKEVLSARELLMEAVNNVLANNYPLPDIDWEWAWDTWYVTMLYDVDEEGWIYLYLSFRSKYWKGRYYFGNFVRRRIWARLRRKQGKEVNPLYLDVKGETASESRPQQEYEDGSTIYVGTPEKKQKRSQNIGKH